MVQVVGELLLLGRDRAAEQVELDLLAAPGVPPVLDRGQDADDDVQRGVLVGDADPGGGGRLTRPSGQVEHPGHGLDEHVLPGPGHIRARLAVAGGADEDDGRVALGELLVAQAEAAHHAGAEVLHHDVELAGQRQDSLAGGLVLQVGGHAALVAVEGEERVGLAVRVPVGDPPVPAPLPLRPLDLDHVGAEVAEDLGGQRSLHERGEIQDPEVAERTSLRRFSLPFLHELYLPTPQVTR